MIATVIDATLKCTSVTIFSKVTKRAPYASWGIVARVCMIAEMLTAVPLIQCSGSTASFHVNVEPSCYIKEKAFDCLALLTSDGQEGAGICCQEYTLEKLSVRDTPGAQLIENLFERGLNAQASEQKGQGLHVLGHKGVVVLFNFQQEGQDLAVHRDFVDNDCNCIDLKQLMVKVKIYITLAEKDWVL